MFWVREIFVFRGEGCIVKVGVVRGFGGGEGEGIKSVGRRDDLVLTNRCFVF